MHINRSLSIYMCIILYVHIDTLPFILSENWTVTVLQVHASDTPFSKPLWKELAHSFTVRLKLILSDSLVICSHTWAVGWKHTWIPSVEHGPWLRRPPGSPQPWPLCAYREKPILHEPCVLSRGVPRNTCHYICHCGLQLLCNRPMKASEMLNFGN